MDLIGHEVWDCCGQLLTPQMRRDILITVAQMYDSWDARSASLEWDGEAGGLVETEPNVVETVGALLAELTGERHPLYRFDFADYSDDLYEWLKGYICEEWGDDAYEPNEDGSDPLVVAETKVFDWLDGIRVDDLLAWRDSELRAEHTTSDWRSVGF